MAGLNKAMIIGRLGKDPEMKYTQDGTPVAVFSVATSEEWKDKNTNEKKEKTEWHRIVAFRKLGELCGEYLGKGRQVYVEGRLQTRSWEKDGITRYTTEIIAEKVQFLDSKNISASTTSEPDTYYTSSPPSKSKSSDEGFNNESEDRNVKEQNEDDIPF